MNTPKWSADNAPARVKNRCMRVKYDRNSTGRGKQFRSTWGWGNVYTQTPVPKQKHVFIHYQVCEYEMRICFLKNALNSEE